MRCFFGLHKWAEPEYGSQQCLRCKQRRTYNTIGATTMDGPVCSKCRLPLNTDGKCEACDFFEETKEALPSELVAAVDGERRPILARCTIRIGITREAPPEGFKGPGGILRVEDWEALLEQVRRVGPDQLGRATTKDLMLKYLYADGSEMKAENVKVLMKQDEARYQAEHAEKKP